MSKAQDTTQITITLTDPQRWALEDLLQALSTQIQLTPTQQQAVTKTRRALDEAI